MIQDRLLRVLLTISFGGSGLFLLAEVIRSPSLRARIDAGTHVLMCAAMMAMIWPWGTNWPVAPQVVIFALAAGWFLGQLWIKRSASSGHAHGSGPFRVVALLYHAVMMLATIWMVTAMSAVMGTPAAKGQRTSMSGMDMSGTDLSLARMPTGGLTAGFAVASGWIFLVIFGAASAFLMVKLVRQVAFRLTDPAAAGEPEPAATDPLGGTVLTVDRRTRPAALAVLLSEMVMAVGMLAMVVAMFR